MDKVTVGGETSYDAAKGALTKVRLGRYLGRQAAPTAGPARVPSCPAKPWECTHCWLHLLGQGGVGRAAPVHSCHSPVGPSPPPALPLLAPPPAQWSVGAGYAAVDFQAAVFLNDANVVTGQVRCAVCVWGGGLRARRGRASERLGGGAGKSGVAHTPCACAGRAGQGSARCSMLRGRGI